jgi:DNA polymerase-3 subunit delta
LLYILAGPDDFSLNQALRDIKNGLGDAAALETCTTVLEGQRVSVDELKNVVETVPFLAEKRLAIIYGLIERFESASRSDRPRAGKAGPQDPTPFITCLGSAPDTTVVIMVESETPDLAKSRFKELVAKAQIKTFPLLKEPRLKPWVQRRVTDLGGTISPAAVDALVQLVGSNLWAMANEVDKLVACAVGRRIEEADVRSLVGYTQEVSVFSMIDAILEFRAESAAQVLQKLLGQGAAPAYLLFMLDRQFRMIVRAKDMKGQGKPDSIIQSKLGLFNDFAFRRTMEQAARYSLERLRKIYDQLLEADVSMKTGRYEGELALELLVAELCQRSPLQPVPPARDW